MKRLRILPEMWASTLCLLPSSTRNMVPASTEVILPSVSITSSTAINNTLLRRAGRCVKGTATAVPLVEQAFGEALRAGTDRSKGRLVSPLLAELQVRYAKRCEGGGLPRKVRILERRKIAAPGRDYF